ncbi:MAG: MFS transporter [Ilumatobacteraceae bacterium]|nr:MFS transporter [Ilumatobacteraceae bacterium]
MNVKRLIVTLQVATAIMSMTYGVMFTMLDDYRDEYGISESGLGLVLAIGFFAAFIGQITLAPLADRGHAKRMMIIGFALVVAGSLVMAFGTTLIALLVGRLVMGVGGGMSLPALRKIVIVSDPDNLGGNMGRLLSVDIAGFALGPMLSAVLIGPFGLASPFLVISAAVVAITVALSRVSVPETAHEDQPSERFAFDLLRIPAVAGAVLIGVALFVMIGTFDSLWALMMEDLEAADWIANMGVSLFAIPMALLGPYGGRLAQRKGPYRVGAIGMTVGAACMTLYGFLPTPALMLVVFFVHIMNDGFTVTSAGVAVGLAAPAERQAGAQGLLGGIQTLVGGMAASLAGWSYDHLGRGPTFTIAAACILACTATGLVLAGDKRWSIAPITTDVSVGAH